MVEGCGGVRGDDKAWTLEFAFMVGSRWCESDSIES